MNLYLRTSDIESQRKIGNSNVVKKLLSEIVDPDVLNAKGLTPLRIAVESKHTAIASLLLQANADPNAADNDNKTSLVVAAETDNAPMVSVLLDNGADPNLTTSKDSNSPL